MHPVCLLAFATIVVVIRADQDRPRVAWVPIETRNISDVVSKALEGSEERLVRIGKMLSDSYDKMARDSEEGQQKIRQLETTSISPEVTTVTTLLMSILSLGTIYL
ncbi:unnamed protein product [Cylicocyclus nassatus]|uniref:Uncharacterized protein n=1 Tax=Cylicocyclus nassatus TaxID=53992 RepID=A0AA36HEL5_CYLNA|nr:unnamed protein product [Cylicocyclus nassatus]